MVQLRKRVEATEEGTTKVRSHPRQGTGHAASLLLAHRSCPTECHSRLCPVPRPALRHVLPYTASCLVWHPVLQCPAPHKHPASLTPCTALHNVLLWVASCPAQCPVLHSDVAVS